MTYTVDKIRNADVAGLMERTDEIIFEIAKAQSAGINGMVSFDRTRIGSYQDLLKSYSEWVVSAPGVDLPETHPREYPLSFISDGIEDDVENKSVRDLIRMYRQVITELGNCQSAYAASGMTVHDKARFDLLMTKIDAFLTNYVDHIQPVDAPESMPSSQPISGGYSSASR